MIICLECKTEQPLGASDAGTYAALAGWLSVEEARACGWREIPASEAIVATLPAPWLCPACQGLVVVPIKACPECLRSYTLPEWRELPLVKVEGTTEHRECSCSVKGAPLVLRLDTNGLTGIWMTAAADEYRRAHPGTFR